MPLYNGRNLNNVSYKGKNLTVDGTVVSFDVAHVNSQLYEKVTFDVSKGYADSKDFGSDTTYYFTPSSRCGTIEYGGSTRNIIEYVCVTYNYENSGLARLELNFEGKGSSGRDWDINFGDSTSLNNLGNIPEPGATNTNTSDDTIPVDDANPSDDTNPGGNTNPSDNTNSGGGFDRRVYAMQVRLNDAGYTDNNNNPLEEDGLLGPKTRAAAQKAGVDPETWNGTPRLTPASANTSGNTSVTTTTPETFENNKAYGRFLGGADKAEIFAFQKKFGVEPTGIYDEATAEKAYELALDAQSEFTQAGRTIKAWAEKYGSYSSGDQAGYQRAQSEFKTQQMAQAIETSLASLNAALDAYMKGNPAANKRIMYIKNQIAKADFEDAKAKAGVLAQIGKRKQILQLIDAYEKAYMAQQASRQKAVNEIKANFFSILGRINDATILQS